MINQIPASIDERTTLCLDDLNAVMGDWAQSSGTEGMVGMG